MFQIDVKTHNRIEMIDVTKDVQNVVEKSKIKSGLCIVFCPHTTAGLTINENADPSVKSDIIMETNKIIPFDDNYKHMEGNAAAHIKSVIAESF
ncbi:MAG: secondary thiamine-phosphate synthase enzyme YjbQ [Thermoplasmatales archaeon]|nr:secondary thiamine-phosphate synthase enzyme YjbQ [Thermoplasmatales archaeon]